MKYFRSSKRTNVEIYAIGDSILGFQGHPEYNEQWTAAIFHKVKKETRNFQEVFEEVKKTICKEKIDQENLMLILFNFLKRYYM